ncbi:unnamed protein product [Rhodiola kirilowii]
MRFLGCDFGDLFQENVRTHFDNFSHSTSNLSRSVNDH